MRQELSAHCSQKVVRPTVGIGGQLSDSQRKEKEGFSFQLEVASEAIAKDVIQVQTTLGLYSLSLRADGGETQLSAGKIVAALFSIIIRGVFLYVYLFVFLFMTVRFF